MHSNQAETKIEHYDKKISDDVRYINVSKLSHQQMQIEESITE